ncbi:MAG TPA: hypothetical protein VGK77_23790, partial [Candidatus Binatia bacterium]
MYEDLLIPLGFFAVVVLIYWLKRRADEVKVKALAESRRQLFDKFGSGQELMTFMETENGRRLLDQLMSDDGGLGNPFFRETNAQGRVLESVKVGVILTVLGLGMAVLMRWERDMVYPAVILVA